MKILLIHPEDDPEQGPWSAQHWDRIIDLGLGGADSYPRWVEHFQCPVSTLGTMRRGFDDFYKVRDILNIGCGRVIDECGLDWWEILSILLHDKIETLLLMQRFVATLDSRDEIFLSRSGVHGDLLGCVFQGRIRCFEKNAGKRGLRHYARVFNKLSTSQMMDVLCDKYDAGFEFRRRIAPSRRASSTPAVLVPTAYTNVTRTGIAYAHTFPQEKFLFVSTRRSGWSKNLPQNAEGAWLSSYSMPSRSTEEREDLKKGWLSFLDNLASTAEFEILHRLGFLNDFPQRLRDAVKVRDAWRNVLDSEPIQAVLCSDDSNPYTRIPLLLARARGLPNIACHHGALDGRYVFKRTHGDLIWAKGKMERDYLVRRCGVPAEKVEIAAPALPEKWSAPKTSNRAEATPQPHILFLSEGSDVAGGRQVEFYRDILPPLADLALTTGRKLIVKLHPAESENERRRALTRILTNQQRSATQIVSGPLKEELLAGAWFGITILSTVAVECAIRGIPCFLCKWLEFWPYEYIEQFIRYGVGIALKEPGEIKKIPHYLDHYQPNNDAMQNCWQPAAPDRLHELLTSSRREFTAAAS
jgi:hypothetical protein